MVALAAASGARGQEADLKLLLEGVRSIASPGVPGPLCVFGPDAFVVAVGGAGDEVRDPVVAAARLGKGRVVALGHTGYVGDPESAKAADTSRLLANAVCWAAGGKEAAGVRAGVFRQRHAVAALREQGLRAEPLEGADWTARLGACNVLWLCPANLATDGEIAAVRQFVSRGGGLVAGDLGWGWLQLNPGKTLTADHQGNRLLAPAGIVWADGTLERTAQEGFAVDAAPPRLSQADAALAALLADARGESKLSGDEVAQAAAVVTRASRSLPDGDTLLRPKLRRMMEERQDEAVPKPSAPLTLKKPLARLVLAMQIEESRELPAAKVAAHPSAAFFPGDVPRSVPRGTRKLEIDTAVPDWHGTGLYAPAGRVVTVEIPSSAAGKGLWVRVGAHADGLWRHDAWRRAPDICLRKPLAQARTDVASPFGGLVYVEVPRNCRLGKVAATVRGAVEAPHFVLGKTGAAEWRKSVRQRPAPWAELATDKVVLTVPSEAVRKLDDPEGLMRFWDKVLDACADLAGRPKDRDRPERYVTDVQISAGYMHSGYPLMTHLDAAAILVDRACLESNRVDPVWGLFHEMGHNHQSGDWTFDGAGEVTVNLFTLYVLDEVCGIAPAKARDVLSPAQRKKLLDAYTRGGCDFKAWKADPFLALIMYVELQEAFGWEAFRKVFAEYRGLAPGDRPTTDDQRRDQWMARFSKAVGRNLGPFFAAWGVPVSEQARASVADLPEWMPARLGGQPGPRAKAESGKPLSGGDVVPAPRREITGTFSIVAADPDSGVCGAAVASKYPAVGKVVPYVRAGVGAFCTQHWHNPAWGPKALDMLEKGKLPEDVLAELLRDDKDRDKRQLAAIDMAGRAANRNPARADPSGVYWGAMSGRYYACQGNTLAGRDVIVAMARAYEETRGSLAGRLLAALEAGDRAGGDHRGRLAAGIVVAKKGVEGTWLELQVDQSDDAVSELARKYAELKHDAKER